MDHTHTRRLLLVPLLAVLLALAVAAPPAHADGDGNALDRAASDGTGVYQMRVHSYEGAIKAIRGLSGTWGTSFDHMLAGRRGVTYGCGSGCREWTSGLDDSHRWYPQGLGGSRESRWGGAPSSEVVVSAWYLRRSEDDHTSVASTLKFISTSDWKYRNVPLRVPVQTGSGWTTEPLASHAGGVAWAGPYVYVASTDRLYRFDMRQILATRNGPFLLPDRRYLGVDKQPYGAPRLSSVSTDWSGTPALVTAQYRSTDKTAHVVRWPIGDGGALKATDGRVRSSWNFWVDKDSAIDKIQGVEAHKGNYFFSGSKGRLDRARVGTQTARADWSWGTSYLDSDIPQDLYAVPGHRMYGQTEERTDRRIIWRSMASVMP